MSNKLVIFISNGTLPMWKLLKLLIIVCMTLLSRGKISESSDLQSTPRLEDNESLDQPQCVCSCTCSIPPCNVIPTLLPSPSPTFIPTATPTEFPTALPTTQTLNFPTRSPVPSAYPTFSIAFSSSSQFVPFDQEPMEEH